MKIINFGSLNIDYVYSVPHIVRPEETLSTIGFSQFCGGKGLNQSIAAARAGVTVFHAGRYGFDGDVLRDTLADSDVKLEHLRKSEVISGHAIIQVESSGQNSILITAGANHELTKEYIDEVLSAVEPGDILLTQNEVSNVDYIIRAGHEKNAVVAFNPSPITPELLEYPLELADILILNEVEGSAICKDNNTETMLDSLIKMFPETEIVLTLGKAGGQHYAKGEKTRYNSVPATAVDTTGAGDTFCGYFLAGKVMGLHTDEILKRASTASSIAVSRAGASTSIPSIDEVLSRISNSLTEE